MFGKPIAYLRKHISNSNCVKQPLLVNKKMKTASCVFIITVWSDITYPRTPQLFGPTVEILFKLDYIYDGSSVVLRTISDDFRCFPMFSAVFQCFRWVVTFMDNHPLCGHFFSGCPQLITDFL